MSRANQVGALLLVAAAAGGCDIYVDQPSPDAGAEPARFTADYSTLFDGGCHDLPRPELGFDQVVVFDTITDGCEVVDWSPDSDGTTITHDFTCPMLVPLEDVGPGVTAEGQRHVSGVIRFEDDAPGTWRFNLLVEALFDGAPLRYCAGRYEASIEIVKGE